MGRDRLPQQTCQPRSLPPGRDSEGGCNRLPRRKLPLAGRVFGRGVRGQVAAAEWFRGLSPALPRGREIRICRQVQGRFPRPPSSGYDLRPAEVHPACPGAPRLPSRRYGLLRRGTSRNVRRGIFRHQFPGTLRHRSRGLPQAGFRGPGLSRGHLYRPQIHPQALLPRPFRRTTLPQQSPSRLPLPGASRPPRHPSRLPCQLQGRPHSGVAQFRTPRLRPDTQRRSP